jgi:hypothetical protein
MYLMPFNFRKKSQLVVTPEYVGYQDSIKKLQ